MIHNVMRRGIKLSPHDPGPGPEAFKDRNRPPGTGGRQGFLVDR